MMVQLVHIHTLILMIVMNTKIKTYCDVKIGPGYTKYVFNVKRGNSSEGGELCEYVKPDYNKC